MAIHEQLPRQIHRELRQVGWSKAAELVKVARRDGQGFDCATWVHKAQELPKEEFKREVERHLTGQETEPWEMLYFKVYKGQIRVVEQALETAALMLGTDRSRGYCLRDDLCRFPGRGPLGEWEPGPSAAFADPALPPPAGSRAGEILRTYWGAFMRVVRSKPSSPTGP
jgi:hypothetical protein